MTMFLLHFQNASTVFFNKFIELPEAKSRSYMCFSEGKFLAAKFTKINFSKKKKCYIEKKNDFT